MSVVLFDMSVWVMVLILVLFFVKVVCIIGSSLVDCLMVLGVGIMVLNLIVLISVLLLIVFRCKLFLKFFRRLFLGGFVGVMN